ncbi:MAG: hypothetical protein SNJ84_03740 [Verrucomicrobiia bacterium]
MLPEWVPWRTGIILATGAIELALAIALMFSRTARSAGMVACLFLIAVFPANIYAAWTAVDFGGHAMGPVYLLIRFPLQMLLIGWAWWFAVRRDT